MQASQEIKIKNSKLLESALILFGIWTFAFITGLGTSIVRAAVMFSLIQFAACINRKQMLSTHYLLVAFHGSMESMHTVRYRISTIICHSAKHNMVQSLF